LFSSRQIILLLSADNKDKKYYNEGNISPSMAIVLSQLFHYSLHPSIKTCITKEKGRIAEFVFQPTEDPNAEQCPFLIDEQCDQNKKESQEIIIANMAEPRLV
jgi:hypothetical protein